MGAGGQCHYCRKANCECTITSNFAPVPEPDMFARFRCKHCEGRGRIGDDIPCEPCAGEGYTIPAEQRQLWSSLMRVIEAKVSRYKVWLFKEAEATFNKHFPPENPLCQAHPNVRQALLAASAANEKPLNTLTPTDSGKRNFVSRAISGLNMLRIPRIRWSRKTTNTTASDPKNQRLPRVLGVSAGDHLQSVG